MFGRGLKTLSLLSVALIIGAFFLVFFYAPNEADQGFIQKIFYLHVPLAIVALVRLRGRRRSTGSSTCAAATARTICAPTSRSTCR